jgi:elongation factor G
MQDLVDEYRAKLVEDISEADDALMEKYLEGGDLTKDEILGGLKKAVEKNLFLPVFCGSSTKNIGVAELFDFISDVMPSPQYREKVTGKHPTSQEEVTRKIAAEQPFSGLVIKTMSDEIRKFSIMRVLSGVFEPDGTVYNPNRDIDERYGSIFFLNGKATVTAGKVAAGDLVAIAKLKETVTGDTLCDKKFLVMYEPMPKPQPLINFAVRPKSKADQDKVVSSLRKLMEEDSTLQMERHQQTNELILSGMGEKHIETVCRRLERKFKVAVTLSLPTVPYLETIKGKADVRYRHKKQTGGAGQFGEVAIKVEPNKRGAGFEFIDNIVGGVIPGNFIPSVEKGVRTKLEEGILAAFPVVDVKVSLYDGKYHPVDSKDIAFQMAGIMAMKESLEQANPVLLEPIMIIEVTVPDADMGNIVGDLNSRRGRILGMEPKGNYQVVKATVPQAEILRYAPDLDSMTSGRGDFTTRFDHYEEVPAMFQDKVIAEAKRKKEEQE